MGRWNEAIQALIVGMDRCLEKSSIGQAHNDTFPMYV